MNVPTLILITVFSGIVAVGCWLGWQLLQQNGRILLRLEELEERLNQIEFGEAEPQQVKGLPLGLEAPAFELPDLEGKTRKLGDFRGQPLLLIFFSPECGYCRKLAPKLATPTSHQMVFVSEGDAETNRKFFAEHKLDSPVLLQKHSQVASAYHVQGTPMGYLISAEGRIASELATGEKPLLALLNGKAERRDPKSETGSGHVDLVVTNEADRADRFKNRSLAHSKLKRDGLKAGTPAPDFRLPRLDGRGQLALSELRGRIVLLVFSDPHCGPCQALAPQLEALHRKQSEVAIVMISRGEPSENHAKVKEHGLTFPVVLQHQWEISRCYAMFATPIAYLIGEDGILLRDVALGTDAILDLAKAREVSHNGQPVAA
jgi:peroxiredoxin